MKKLAYVLVLTGAAAVAFAPPVYYAHRQLLENRIMDEYLRSTNLMGLSISKQSAILVSDQVRRDFNTDVKTFAALKMGERPFLREDAAFLLTHREGECGEGTRVIANLLFRLGFDATRITLYDRNLTPAHTLVSVLINGNEFLIDSINSSAEWNRSVRMHDLSPIHFGVLRYSSNIVERTAAKKAAGDVSIPETLSRFLNHYWLYSYEAVPYTKLAAAAGFNVRIFNFERPHRWISALAEKPNLVMLIITLAISITAICLLHRLARKIIERRAF